MSDRAETKVLNARLLADRLAREGRAMDAEIVRALCRQNSSYRETCRRLHADNQSLRGRWKVA